MIHEGPLCSQGRVTLGGEDIYRACQYFVACARLRDSRDVVEMKQIKAKEDAPLSPSPAGFLHNFLLHDCLTILNSGTG